MCPAYPADPERPQPPARLGMYALNERLRPVGPRDALAGADPEVLLEILPILRHVTPSTPGGGLRPKRQVRLPEAIDVDVMQERGEPHILVLPRHRAHTDQPTWARSARHRVRSASRWPRFPWRSPFLHRLRRPALGRCSTASAGTTGSSDFPRSCIHGITALAFPARHETRLSPTSRTIQAGYDR